MASRIHKVEEEALFDAEHGLQEDWWKVRDMSGFSQAMRKERKLRLARVYSRTRAQLRRGVITMDEAARIFGSVGCYHCRPTIPPPPPATSTKFKSKKPAKKKKNKKKLPVLSPKKEPVDAPPQEATPPTPSYEQLLAGVGVD